MRRRDIQRDFEEDLGQERSRLARELGPDGLPWRIAATEETYFLSLVCATWLDTNDRIDPQINADIAGRRAHG